VTVRTTAERGETETSFTVYYVPLDERLTATGVASRKGRIPLDQRLHTTKRISLKKRVSGYAVSQKRQPLSNDEDEY